MSHHCKGEDGDVLALFCIASSKRMNGATISCTFFVSVHVFSSTTGSEQSCKKALSCCARSPQYHHSCHHCTQTPALLIMTMAHSDYELITFARVLRHYAYKLVTVMSFSTPWMVITCIQFSSLSEISSHCSS